MTKGNFFKYYNKLSGADRYLIFFERNGLVYLWDCKHIAPRWTRERYESSSKGGYQKFRIEMTVKDKNELIAKGATPMMTFEEFKAIPQKNNGHKCECWLHKKYNLGTYKPDAKRFDKCGDVCINGVEYQVKFQNASLTNVEVLHKAQKDARKRG